MSWKNSCQKDLGICRFFLLEDMGRVGCWFQINSSYVHLEKNEEMMEVWIYSISMWRDDEILIFFSQTGLKPTRER